MFRTAVDFALSQAGGWECLRKACTQKDLDLRNQYSRKSGSGLGISMCLAFRFRTKQKSTLIEK